MIFNSNVRVEKLLEAILTKMTIQNKLLARLAGVSEDSLETFELKEVDFSETVLHEPPSPEELLADEEEEISEKIKARLSGEKLIGGRSHFYEEDVISDIHAEVNEG